MIRTKIGIAITAGFLIIGAQAQNPHLTAREVVARIQKQVGVPWQSDTVDTFKSGNPDAPVSGIAVTMMATLDVPQRAAAAGDNLIITHEPTFFDHLDISDQLPEKEADPVLVAKRKFIADHNLVIWRFHDHWHARNPDGIEAGMVHALGWEKFQDPKNQYLFNIPETSLNKLASDIKRKLGINIVRVVGRSQSAHHQVSARSRRGWTHRPCQSPRNARSTSACHRRSAGVGGGRVRRRRRERRKTEVTYHPQPYPLGTGGNGGVRALAEDVCDGGSNPVRSGSRAFLEPKALGANFVAPASGQLSGGRPAPHRAGGAPALQDQDCAVSRLWDFRR